MASYTFQNAVDFVSKYAKGIPTSALDTTACDTVNSIIWRAWFWRWSIASLTSINTVNLIQDYTIANADFYRLWRCRMIRTDVSPFIIREKDVVSFLSPNLEQQGGVDTIQAMSYIDAVSLLRLDKAMALASGTQVYINGDYQQKPTKVTSLSQTIPFPDHYFDVLIEGLKWKYYQLGDDPRAGEPQVSGGSTMGQRAYTGQLGIFYSALQEMMLAEGFSYGDSQRFPDSGMGVGRLANPGLFGWA